MLVTFKSAVQKTVLEDNVATFTTVGDHEFTEGQSVVIAGCFIRLCGRSVQPTTNKTTMKLQKENKGKVNERVEKHAIQHDEKHLIKKLLSRCRTSGAPVPAGIDKEEGHHC